jgi:hypothetical protein
MKDRLTETSFSPISTPFKPNNLIRFTRILAIAIGVLCFLALSAGDALAQTITFESPTYTVGNINGQNGWSKTGPYDANVALTSFPGFGAQTLRISNSVTSGSFGDQVFSRSIFNQAGETAAEGGAFSGGARLRHFEAQFELGSAVPGSQQAGLSMSMSPDRGDGARMSYLRFEDQLDGIHIFFVDYQDLAPFGGSLGDTAGCDNEDIFNETDIATVSRTSAHTIKIVMDLVDGTRNDIVKIYVDGVLKITGTSWEDYFRYCEGNQPRTVDSLLIRNASAAVPANAGNGFLFDNMTLSSSAPTSTVSVGAASLTPTPNLTSWFFYNDETDVLDNNLGSFVAGPASPPLGVGSAQISVSGTQRRNLATYRFGGTPLSSIAELKFSTYNPSAGNGGSANRSAYLNFNVDFTGVGTSFQRRLSYVPSSNGAVTQNQWKEWDAIDGGNAKWFYSGPTWPAGIGGGGEAGTSFKTWSQILSQYPNIRILPTDPFLGIRVGEPYADGYTENIDAFKFGTAAGTTQYNFEPQATSVYVDDNWVGTTPGADPDGGGPATSFGYDAFATVGDGANGVSPGGTVTVYSGTYTLTGTVNLNKAGVTIIGSGTKPVVQAASSIGNAFFVTASNVTIDSIELRKTDLADQQLIAVQGNNFTAKNNLIYGPDPGAIWNVAGYVSRAFVISAQTGTLIQNNVIHTLRQPAYMSGGATTGGTIKNNQVSGTKGWVVEGGNYIFTGNTFGEPQNQSCDIALLASVAPLNNATYEPLIGLSQDNDNAFICQQYGALENGRAVAYVNDGAGPGGNGSDNANYNSINAAIAGTLIGGTVSVAGGTYNEDVTVGKTVKVLGAGAVSTTVSGPIGGPASTFAVTGNNVEISGFTITRAGNNTTDWNNANLNTAGVSVQGLAVTGMLLHDNRFTGNRTGIDINNSNGHTIRNNVIDNNRTGLIFRNQTDNLTFVENDVTNNWTVGIVFLDGSGGTNSPVQSASNCSFFNNNFSGNWYGQIVDRQSGGSLPAPGTNLKNFSGNWFGFNAPVVTTTNSAEPGYAAQIPVAFGGSAVPPGGQPDIEGPASANFDISPYLNVGTDANVETAPGRGTYGFQGTFNALNVSATSAQVGGLSKIQEAINLLTAGGTLSVPTGTYAGNVDVNKAITLKGTFTIAPGTLSVSVNGATLSPGFSPGIINSGNLSLTTGSNLNMELNGTTAGALYDQLNVTGTVSLGGATLNLTLGYSPSAGDAFTIVNNDGADAVAGTFAGLPDGTVFSVGGSTLRIDYDGGDGNDVVLTTVSLCNTVSIPTNITTLTGQTVNVPLNVDDTTGHGLFSTDFTLNYNAAVLGSPVVTLGSVVPVAPDTLLTVNTSVAGVIRVSIFASTPFAGAGTLVNVAFTATGAPGTSSPVSFSAFQFNEGTPCLTTNNGLVTILSGTITGTVTYGNTPAAPLTRPVPNATLSAVGSVNVSAVTDGSGIYSLSGMGSGPYTVTPSKSADYHGAISAFDAARIAQFVVGLTTLNPTQQQVADVSGAGGVTSFDASMIARFVAALPGSGQTGTWKFTPVNRSYANVNANISGEDYVALLMGDVSGNWNTTGTTGSRPAATQKPMGLSAGQVTASPNSEVLVPIHIDRTQGKGIISYQFDLTYDPAVITPSTNAFDTATSLSELMAVTVNAETPGRLKVVVFGAMPLDGSGLLLNLRFNAIGAIGTTSELGLEELVLNEGGILTEAVNGRVTVTAPAANEVSISGSLLTATGQGVPNTRVTLTGINGGSRSAMTNGFGYFEFGNVESGQTYTLSVEPRRYTFTPVMVSVTGNMTQVNLIAQP